ncbi:chromosome partitioning protein, ParB family [Halolactibacillus halophilus]|uniref:Chromosome partitioning protein, ParB family n=1 Tax=Halolactibacillus halophilus TaxID=306540 RepID=A0A1I5R704_9BACI|nr:ParB/RepB/Spo0J family partition protein [Halolactibacillus halophilus]GEM02148.1 stage 0 sporulation protein J [Halolactibacillus halophilus]SFP54071.1 chromosome partitioning protein, ParB family [Halolactibacillus halophilus]
MARGLGKGINAFFPELNENETVKEGQVVEVELTKCRPNPYQPRKTFQVEAIEELKQSILTYGIIQPLLVREAVKGFEIIAGERRYRAAKEAGLETVPVIIKDMDDQRMMELALLENLQRENLTPIEEAQAYVNLMKSYSLTQEDLAQKLGKSRPHIANLVRLLQLPAQVTAMINNGELSMGHGRALLGLKDKEALDNIVKKITTEKLNVRQVEQLIQSLNEVKETKKKTKPKKDIFVAEQERLLRQRFGTSVKINQGKKKGKIEIEYYNNKDLERIIELLND